MTAEVETARARVRRLLIHPLEQAGMRRKRTTPPERHQAFLDRLADDLAYLPDTGLARLRVWAEANGEGADRSFWPPFVAFAGLAQAIAPRPVEDMPELASWFTSRAGPEAAAVPGRLVAEFRFIQSHRRPPIKDAERRRIADGAAALAHDVQRARELRDAGRMYDAPMLEAYMADLERAMRLVDQGEEKRRGVA